MCPPLSKAVVFCTGTTTLKSGRRIAGARFVATCRRLVIYFRQAGDFVRYVGPKCRSVNLR